MSINLKHEGNIEVTGGTITVGGVTVNPGATTFTTSSVLIDNAWTGPTNGYFSSTYTLAGLEVGDYVTLTPDLDAVDTVIAAEVAPLVDIQTNGEFILFAKNVPAQAFTVNVTVFKNN